MKHLNNKLLGWCIADTLYLKCIEVTGSTYFGLDSLDSVDSIYSKYISSVQYQVSWRGNYCMVFKNIEDAKGLLIHTVETSQSCHKRVIDSYNKQRTTELLQKVSDIEYHGRQIDGMFNYFEKRNKRMLEHERDMFIICEKQIENIRKYGESLYMELHADLSEKKSKEAEASIRYRAYFIAEADGFFNSPDYYWQKSYNEYYSC